MTFFERLGIERKLRTIHSWLGVVILPWVIMAGLTGFYLNHSKAIGAAFPHWTQPGPSAFEAEALARPVASKEAAVAIARGILPEDAPASLDRGREYEDRAVFTVDTGRDKVYVDRATGYAWHRQRYHITRYAPDGHRLGSDLRWSRILKSLHVRGWVGSSMGRWLADATAFALVLFGFSGLVVFVAPRLRRRRNRRARRAAAAMPANSAVVSPGAGPATAVRPSSPSSPQA